MTQAENKNRAAIGASIIEELGDLRTAAVAALDSLRGTLLGQGFIVVSKAGLALKYDIDGDTKNVRGVSLAGGAAKATRFTKLDADNLAAATIDGRGDPAAAVHVTQALRDEIDRLEASMEQIRAALAVE